MTKFIQFFFSGCCSSNRLHRLILFTYLYSFFRESLLCYNLYCWPFLFPVSGEHLEISWVNMCPLAVPFLLCIIIFLFLINLHMLKFIIFTHSISILFAHGSPFPSQYYSSISHTSFSALSLSLCDSILRHHSYRSYIML